MSSTIVMVNVSVLSTKTPEVNCTSQKYEPAVSAPVSEAVRLKVNSPAATSVIVAVNKTGEPLFVFISALTAVEANVIGFPALSVREPDIVKVSPVLNVSSDILCLLCLSALRLYLL